MKNANVTPSWLPYIDVTFTSASIGLWYALPQAGAWPIVLALAPWALRLALTGRPTQRTPFDLPLALFLLSAGVGVWAAYDRQAAWSKFWLIVGSVLVFYTLVNTKAVAGLQSWLLASVGAGWALYFLATHNWDAYPAKIKALVRLGQTLQASRPALPSNHVNPNEVGGILAMMLPFTGLVTFGTWQKVQRTSGQPTPKHWLALVAVLGALILTSFGLLMTMSRGAWIALVGALLLASLLMALRRWSWGNARRRAWVCLAMLVLLLGGLVGMTVAGPERLSAALTALPGPDTGLSRAEFQLNSLTLVRDYPFIGAGLDSFEMLYSTYILLIHVGFIKHSHNLFLNVAIDQGLPGLLALVWMWALFAKAVWQGLLHPKFDEICAAPVPLDLGAAASALFIALVHGIADNALYGKAGVVLLFAPLAFAVPYLPQKPQGVEQRLMLYLPIGATLVVILALVYRGPLLSTIYSNLGAVHQSQSELSVYSWPEWPVQDAVRQAVDLSQPIAEFERALVLDPRNPTANRRLGQIELSLGEYEDALTHLEAAYAVEPGSETTRQLLGEAMTVNGRVDEGQSLWTGVQTEQGQLDLRLFWYQHIGDAKRAAWVQKASDLK